MNYLNKTPSQPSPSQGEEQNPKGRDGVIAMRHLPILV